jgi:hypothetical protein
MNIRRFAGSLTLLPLFAVLMPQSALHSQSPPKTPTSSAKPADDSPKAAFEISSISQGKLFK